jgi:DMSO/TMAO reductase YedYZ heme-binding membrane subunit
VTTSARGAWVRRAALPVAGLAVTWFWWVGTPPSVGSTPGTALIAAAELVGLLASVLVCAQLLLVARIPWLVRQVGPGPMVTWHVSLGATTTLLVATHVVAMIAGGVLVDGGTPWGELWTLLVRIDHLPLALLGTVLMLAVGVSSARAVRSRISGKAWHYVHLTVYPALILVFLHQVAAGAHFVGRPLAQAVWTAVYGGTLAAVVRWRIAPPLVRRLRPPA